MTTTFAYDSEGDLSQTTEQMPAGQQRTTITQNNTVNDPSIGISARQRSTVNCILVSTSLSQTIGYASKSVTLSGTSTSIRSFPNDGAWTVISTAPDGTDTKATYTDGLMKKQEQRSTTDSVITSTSMTQDAFGRTLTQVDSRTGTTTMGAILENGSYASMTAPGNRVTAFSRVGPRITTNEPTRQPMALAVPTQKIFILGSGASFILGSGASFKHFPAFDLSVIGPKPSARANPAPVTPSALGGGLRWCRVGKSPPADVAPIAKGKTFCIAKGQTFCIEITYNCKKYYLKIQKSDILYKSREIFLCKK